MVEQLIKNGAHVNFRDNDVATSLHRAVEQGDHLTDIDNKYIDSVNSIRLKN